MYRPLRGGCGYRNLSCRQGGASGPWGPCVRVAYVISLWPVGRGYCGREGGRDCGDSCRPPCPPAVNGCPQGLTLSSPCAGLGLALTLAGGKLALVVEVVLLRPPCALDAIGPSALSLGSRWHCILLRGSERGQNHTTSGLRPRGAARKVAKGKVGGRQGGVNDACARKRTRVRTNVRSFAGSMIEL